MKIAIVGTRGVPAAYGGFETFAEELSRRLAERGHNVSVYCRRRRVGRGDGPAGVRRVFVPCVYTKYLETVSHTAASSIHALSQGYDAVVMCNAANAAFAWLPRLQGAVVALNVDGLERNRSKWGSLGRLYYQLSERVALVTPNTIVSDARVIEEYYQRRYRANSTYIPYGANPAPVPPPPPRPDGPLRRYGLRPAGYVLYVSRLEPENHAHTVITAFEHLSDLDLNLVVTGHAPYAHAYRRRLREMADARTIFTGGVYGDGYDELQGHALIYVHATSVGGVHPALIEAMSHAQAIACSDTRENRETLGEAGLYFSVGDAEECADAIRRLASDAELRARLGSAARARALREYSWEKVADAYLELLDGLLNARNDHHRRRG